MRDIAIRAGKTFVQAALGYVCTLNLTGTDWGDKTVIAGIVVAAISAGLSALMNIDWESLI